MKIACIGGGPAGLYLGILVKRSAPQHDVVVYERNRPADTFGFGVVFSDATLGHLAAADPESHAAIAHEFARWDDIEVHAGGEILRSTGHGFCGLERKTLLQILQARAAALGVRVEFEHEVKSLAEIQADVVVGCDGVASWVRDALAADITPQVDVRSNKFVWLGGTVPYRAFTFLFKQSAYGLFRVHAYRYHRDHSTFIVECREDTWRNAGLELADENLTIEILTEVFAEELAGHTLTKNRSIWRSFPTVRCKNWYAGNVVLLGDAAHTAHFSIGSGTKLAMEDAIVLRDELLSHTDVPAALAAYQARRKPEVEALQAAAQASLEWFEGTERYMEMAPVQLMYSLMTRSLRVSHASVAKRDPHLARGVEQLLAGGGEPMPPTALPFELGDRRAQRRVIVAPDAGSTTDDQLVALGAVAIAGAGLVVTPVLAASALANDDAAVAWQRIVDYVHGKHALIIARVAIDARLDAAVERAAFAGFDVLLLDAEGEAREALPAAVQAARRRWRAGGWIAARVHDQPGSRTAVVGYAAQLVRAGADLLWVTSAGDGNARLPAATLADRLRNELRVATAVDGADALLPDLDAAIAAGRADLVVVRHLPNGVRRVIARRYQLRKEAVGVVRGGAPWIFRDHLSSAANVFADGQWLRLVGGDNKVEGYGFYEASGAIAIRILRRGVEPPDVAWIKQRVAAALKKRELLATTTTGLRLIHGESDGLPAVVVERIGDTLIAQSYARGADALARYATRLIGGAPNVLLRPAHRQKRSTGDEPARVLRGAPPAVAPFVEEGIAYAADLEGGQKTGTYLDLRGLRRAIATMPLAGARVLNLFSYTGMLGRAAEHAGATAITQVDASKRALAFAAVHHVTDPAHHQLVEADVFEWLPAQRGSFSLVIVDPPSMTSDKKQVPAVLAGYRKLYRAAAPLVAPGGLLVAACCTSRVERPQFHKVVEECLPGFALENDLRPELDHPIGFREADYLKIELWRRGS